MVRQLRGIIDIFDAVCRTGPVAVVALAGGNTGPPNSFELVLMIFEIKADVGNVLL
jgi:hypothetical protein